jgi:hypothetical protein
MSSYTPQQKHRILTHYRAGERGAGFKALARRFAVAGGATLVSQWHARWDGTPASLQEQQRSGRPRLLSAAEVSRHVRAPILAANRAHRAISYPQLLPQVQLKTGKQLSLRSLQRYGKEMAGATAKATKKRTAVESECTRIGERERACMLTEHVS